MPERKPIDDLLDVMARLRDPEGGCPWDREQTFATIAPHTLEEAYEVADAIARGDRDALRDELGDLLFQIVFYAQMSREEGGFDFDDVARAITDKMVRRHPHVFGDAKISTAAAQTQAWEAHKTAERRRAAGSDGALASALDGVALGLPALTRALKLQRRAARVGFDWPHRGPVIAKIREEVDELAAALEDGAKHETLASELGDLLFAIVNLARHLGLDGEAALREANAKFERRFRAVEAKLAAAGKTPETSTLDDMDRLWEEVKTEERAASSPPHAKTKEDSR